MMICDHIFVLNRDRFSQKLISDRLLAFAILYSRFFEESGSKGFKRTNAATLISLLSS